MKLTTKGYQTDTKTVDACNRHPCGAVRITLPWLIEKMGLPNTNSNNKDAITNNITENAKSEIRNEIDGTNTNAIDPKINENIDMSMTTNTDAMNANTNTDATNLAPLSAPKRRFPIKRSLTLEGNDTNIGNITTLLLLLNFILRYSRLEANQPISDRR